MFQLWVNYVLKRQMPPCPRLYMSSMDTLQSTGFLPLKLVFSTVLFGDEPDSHCTSTPHCLENRGIARLISVLASGLLGYCGCSQPLTCTSERFNSLLEAVWSATFALFDETETRVTTSSKCNKRCACFYKTDYFSLLDCCSLGSNVHNYYHNDFILMYFHCRFIFITWERHFHPRLFSLWWINHWPFMLKDVENVFKDFFIWPTEKA